MNESILIVEDEQELCLTLGDRLRNEGYVLDFAADGNTGLEKAIKQPFDLIILDIMLPVRSGLDVCVDIRRAGVDTPVLLLTARSQTVDKVVGLKLGADDYVTKPFDTMEFIARVEALLRRGRIKRELTQSKRKDRYRFGQFDLDVRRSQLTCRGEPVYLTAREFQLLCYFLEHSGETLSREELLREVWGYRGPTFTRTVDVHVASLRQKLEPDSSKSTMIITIPGIGYSFQDT